MSPLLLGFLLLQEYAFSLLSLDSADYDSADQTTSFNYEASSDETILSWTLGLESCVQIKPVRTVPATSLSLGLDSVTNIFGIKWHGYSSRYVLKLAGHVKVGSTTYGINQGAYKTKTGIIDGPICAYYDDVVCNAGGPYQGVCHNNHLSVHLLGHQSLHATAYSWKHFITGANLLTPNSVASVITLPIDACLETYRISLTVTGQDTSDKRTCLAYIFVEDATAPVWDNIYERDISAEPHDIPAPMLLTAHDDCDVNVIVKFREERVETGHQCAYELHRTWTAIDSCANTAFHTQIISVMDTQPPVLSGVEPDGTYDCDVVPPPCTVEANDYDDVTLEVREFKNPGPCDCEYSITRKWIATDCAGNTATQSQKITVEDKVAPRIFGVPADTTVDCDAIPSVPSPSATDNCCGATIQYWDSKLAGSCVHDYRLVRTWFATDSCGYKDSQSQTITVEDNDSPVLSGAFTSVTVECDEVPLPCEVEANDNCDSHVIVNFDDDEQEGTCDDEREIRYTWTATDYCGNEAEQTQTVWVQDTELPVMSGLPPHSLTVDCDALPTFYVRATDNCDPNVSPQFEEITSERLYTHDYTTVYQWTVTDRCGNYAVWTTSIKVQDLEDPILIGVPDDIHTTCDNIPEAAEVEGTDNCCTEYRLEPNHSQDTIGGTCEHSYTIVNSWALEDCNHNIAYASQTITVEDLQAPVFHGLPSYEVVLCDQIPEFAEVTATDNCQYEVTATETEITEQGSCKTQYKILRTWSAVDICGNSASYTQTIVTYDDHAPVLTEIPHDTTVQCEYLYNNVLPEVTDNCDEYVSVSEESSKKDGTCEYDWVFYRHWFAADDCGNLVTASQTITLIDDEPPYWIDVPPAAIESEYPEEPDVPTPSATDNCSYAPEITFNERKLQFGYLCPKAYRLVRAWFVIDVCGNMGPPIYQHVIIDDHRAPTFILPLPPNVTVECDDIPPPPPVYAVDHYEEIEVTLRKETEFGTCNHDYDIIRTWYAQDSCGNLDQTTSVVSVYDNTPPSLYNVPKDLTIECEQPPPATVTAEDNCDGYIDVSFVSENVEEGIAYDPNNSVPWKTVYRHWSVSDDCGNTADVYQTISIFDTKSPTFQNYASNVVYECDDVPLNPIEVRYSDECDSNPSATLDKWEAPSDCLELGTIIYTWTVIDYVEHSATFSQTITVVDTTPPVFEGYVQDTIDVECNSGFVQPAMLATDNCDPDLTTVPTTETYDIDFKCVDKYMVLWIWTATDKCGNKASYTKTVNVDDTTPPELLCDGVPCIEYEFGDSIECEDPFLLEVLTVTATDNCDENVEIIDTHITEDGTCEDAYSRISSYIATDNCGNEDTWARTIVVVDTTPPKWETTPDQTKRVPYDGDLNCPTTQDLSASDVCDDSVSVECTAVIENGICPQEYTKTCTCVAVDNCGNNVNFVQVIDVYDNYPPIITQPPQTTVQCLNYLVAPSDPYVNWQYASGRLSVTQRTVPDGCDYTVIYTWVALDDCHLQDTVLQTVIVEDTNAPVISGVPASETVECHPGAPVEYLTGHDECDGKVLVIFDSEKILVDGPYCYTLIRTWSAVDHCGHVTERTQTVVVEDNSPPVISYPPGNLTTDCHSLPFASEDDISVDDNCDADRNVSFTDTREDGTCDCEWKQYRTWVACDSCGNCRDATQTITVIDDLSPSLSIYPGDLTVQTGDVPYPPEVIGYDNYGAQTNVDYDENRENSTYRLDSPWVYKLYRSWTTSDSCGNTDHKEQTVTVIDTIPIAIIGVPKDVVLECPEVIDVNIPDINVPPEYQSDAIEQVIQDNIPDGEEFTITLVVDEIDDGTCESEWIWRRCWETEDHVGNTNQACFTITSVDDVPPQWLTYPEVEFAECNPTPIEDVAIPAADDNCNCDVTVAGEVEDNRGGAYSGHVVRIWTATDCCGATAVHTQTVWIADTEPPTWSLTPEDTTICCDDDLPIVDMTATDTCHGDVAVITVDWKEVICEGEYILFYNWRAQDEEGNWISHFRQIYVEDCYTPELWAGLSTSYNVDNAVAITDSPDHNYLEKECPWIETHQPVYATDICQDYAWDVSLYDISRWGDDCNAFVAFSWSVVDDCGHEASHSQTVKIIDSTPPVITGCPLESVTKHCGEPLDKPWVAGSDLCDPLINVERSEEHIPGTCLSEFSTVVTWSIEDRCGYVDECKQTVTFEDRQAPVLTLHGPEHFTAPCDTPYEVPAVSATDDCQDYFDIEFDQVQNDGTCPCEYELVRTWTTEDKCGATAEKKQTVSVVDEQPPVIHGKPRDVTVQCLHEPPKPALSASDNCCEVTLSYDQSEPEGTCPHEYMFVRTWDANDECGHTAHYEYTVTVVDGEPPRFNSHSLQTFVKVECNAIPPEATLTATDNCGDATVTSDEFTHSGTCDDEYALVRRWEAVDICGNTVSYAQTLSVVDTTPPTLELPNEGTYECDDIPTHEEETNRVADDNCDPDPDVTFQSNLLGADCSDNWSVMLLWITTDRCGNEAIYSLVVPVDDITFPELHNVPDDTTVTCTLPDVDHVTATDNCDHQLTPSFVQELPYAQCPYVFTAVRRWTVTDRCLNTEEREQTITVLDDGDPELEGVPGDETMGCKDSLVPAKVNGIDHCQRAINVAVDVRVVPGSCPNQYVTIVTWSAEDDCGGFTSDSQTVTVHDNVPPEISEPPVYMTAECDSIPSPPTMVAQDDCSYGVEVILSESIVPGTCDNEYEIHRVWVSQDECGNLASKTAKVSVSDTIGPTIPYHEQAQTAPCDDVPPMPSYTPVDNCGGYIRYEENEERINGTCLHEYQLVRTYTITDACGNQKTHSYIVHVTDQDDPVLLYAPADASVECDDYPAAPELSAQDSCGYAPTVDDSEYTIPESCPYLYKTVRTWVATDECGRQDQHIQTVTHEDTTPPVINGHEDVICEIGNVPPPWRCTWSDNCDDDDGADYVVVYNEGSCIHQYTNTYTCTATDCAGNTATSNHVIHVFDTIPPTIFGLPPDTTVEYQKVPPLKHAHLGVSVTDNSDSQSGTNGVYSASLNPPEDTILPGYDKNDFVIIRTYTAKDACDNHAQHQQTIKVIDRTKPCFDEEPEDITVECDAIPEPCEIFTVGENLEVSFYEKQEDRDGYAVWLKRTWSATDHSGNTYSWTQIITIEDTHAPVFTRHPEGTLNVDCDCEDFPAMPVLGAIDNCDEFVVVHKDSEVIPDELCEDKYSIKRTWTVQDHSGESSTFVQWVHVTDTEDPTFSSNPQDVTFDCHEDTFSRAPKFTVYDNCDPDPTVTGISTRPDPIQIIGSTSCQLQYRYEAVATDRCGNTDTRKWTLTFEDNDDPVIQGSKHCIHKSSWDGYGSRELYKKYRLNDLISHDDTCTQTHVTGVFFNRSTDDSSNLLESANIVQVGGGSYLNGDANTWEATVYTMYGASYYLKAAIGNPANHLSGPQKCTILVIDQETGDELLSLDYTPALDISRSYAEYDMHFNAESDITSVRFSCGAGYFWQLDQYPEYPASSHFPVCHTSHGEGLWAKAGFTDTPLECDNREFVTGVDFRCTSINYKGTIYNAIVNQDPQNDRFCFAHGTQPWSSITHYSFSNPRQTWWVRTNFATQNPNSYQWNSFDVTIALILDRNPSFSPEQIMTSLRNRGTINDFWLETVDYSPIDDPLDVNGLGNQISCHNTRGQVPIQCQAACYHKGFNTAVLYDSDSSQFASECHCGTHCTPDVSQAFMNGRVGKFTAWQWMEGFFYDDESDQVNILAWTDINDLKIRLWVIVEDDCGHSAMGSVEFWIAPSLEAAGSQGRQCDEADYTPGKFVGSFTSDDLLTPGKLNWQGHTFNSLASVTLDHLHDTGLISGAFGTVWTDESAWLGQGSTEERPYHFRISAAIQFTEYHRELRNFLEVCDANSPQFLNNWYFPHCQNRNWMPYTHIDLHWAGTYVKSTTITVTSCSLHDNSCTGHSDLDVRNFLSNEAIQTSEITAINGRSLNVMESFELFSDADYPLVISNIRITVYRRQSDGSLNEYQSISYSSPDYQVTAPLWTLSDGDSEEGKFTLFHRCVLGNLNWCAPTNEGWFYKDMTMDSIGDLVRSSITRTLPSSEHVDLNVLFADVINDQGFGCPRTNALRCGPLRHNKYCSGKGGRTHCIEAMGQCVSQDDASGHPPSTFGSNDLDSSCQSTETSAAPAGPVTADSWINVSPLPGVDGFGIARPVKTDYCSTADIAVAIVNGVWQYPDASLMYPTSLSTRPQGWYDGGRANDDSGLMQHIPVCLPTYVTMGALFNDINQRPDESIETRCCVPSAAVESVPKEEVWDLTHPFSNGNWRYDPITSRVILKWEVSDLVNVFKST